MILNYNVNPIFIVNGNDSNKLINDIDRNQLINDVKRNQLINDVKRNRSNKNIDPNPNDNPILTAKDNDLISNPNKHIDTIIDIDKIPITANNIANDSISNNNMKQQSRLPTPNRRKNIEIEYPPLKKELESINMKLFDEE
jgi:hypothetical protein